MSYHLNQDEDEERRAKKRAISIFTFLLQIKYTVVETQDLGLETRDWRNILFLLLFKVFKAHNTSCLLYVYVQVLRFMNIFNFHFGSFHFISV